MTSWTDFWEWWGRNSQFGTLAEWVGGLGAAGALVLGLAILWREIRQNKQAVPRQIIIWVRKGEGEGIYIVTVRNTSSLPILDLNLIVARGLYGRILSRIVSKIPGWPTNAFGVSLEAPSVIEPNGNFVVEVDLGTSSRAENYKWIVGFFDGYGDFWARDVTSGRFISRIYFNILYIRVLRVSLRRLQVEQTELLKKRDENRVIIQDLQAEVDSRRRQNQLQLMMIRDKLGRPDYEFTPETRNVLKRLMEKYPAGLPPLPRLVRSGGQDAEDATYLLNDWYGDRWSLRDPSSLPMEERSGRAPHLDE